MNCTCGTFLERISRRTEGVMIIEVWKCPFCDKTFDYSWEGPQR